MDWGEFLRFLVNVERIALDLDHHTVIGGLDALW